MTSSTGSCVYAPTGTTTTDAPTTTTAGPTANGNSGSWSEMANRFCASTEQMYPSLAEAQAACEQTGTGCFGVYDNYCDAQGGYQLCKKAVYMTSSTGSCVYARTGTATTEAPTTTTVA